MKDTIGSTIYVSYFQILGKECLRVDFKYSRVIIKLVKNIPNINWSMENLCWYIINENNNFQVLKEHLEVYPNRTYLKRGEKIKSETDYKSVFISYSFVDKDFASRINMALKQNGIKTFLWEKDAPYGKPLKKIMIENINKYDKLLFIASKNSIKSTACQFELTNGRLKQNKLWQEILFPIHIDKYLFQLDKYEIRPKDKAKEYWTNISELREINSADFSEFVNEDYDKTNFTRRISELIKSLKKNAT